MNGYRIGLLFCALLLWGCTLAPHSGHPAVHHVVLAWFPESVTQEQLDEVIEATRALRVIPGVTDLHVGRSVPSDRGIVDDSFDIGIVMSFESADAMHRYLGHPAHERFVERYVRGRAERLVVYDIRDSS